MRSDSATASGESNRHNSTLVACSEKSAKFTPPRSRVAPSGDGRPGQTRGLATLFCPRGELFHDGQPLLLQRTLAPLRQEPHPPVLGGAVDDVDAVVRGRVVKRFTGIFPDKSEVNF